MSVLALACCASQPVQDCGYRPHVRTASDAEARKIDTFYGKTVKIADLNDAGPPPDLPDTAREFGTEDHVMVVQGTIERIAGAPNGAFVLTLGDHSFHVLAYVPSAECTTDSAFRSQIRSVRRALVQRSVHVGDQIAVTTLVFFDVVTPGGATSGVSLTPVLGLRLPNGTTYGLVTEESGP
jgi:hypothetical protein